MGFLSKRATCGENLNRKKVHIILIINYNHHHADTIHIEFDNSDGLYRGAENERERERERKINY